jgi:hypothetical protein
MTPEERVRFHQRQSAPVMDQLHICLTASSRRGKWNRTPVWEWRCITCSSSGSGSPPRRGSQPSPFLDRYNCRNALRSTR